MALEWYQYGFVAALFIWSGLLRSGFGFGGAVFTLPFLLLIDENPLIFLPIIAVHMLIFSSATIYQNHRKSIAAETVTTDLSVDWGFLKKALLIMLIPKMIGVFGLLTLPSKIMNMIIFTIVSVYALSYLLNKPFQSKNKSLDVVFLILGGYISGTSLIGAPLIVAVYSKYVDRHRLRDTLFATWFILVAIKMGSFVYYDIDLQWAHHLWLLPCATIGHVVGLRLHDYLLTTDSVSFYRVLGAILLLTSVIGVARVL